MRRALLALVAALLGWILIGAALEPSTSRAQVQSGDLGHEIAGSLLPGFPSGRPFYVAVIGSDARPGVCEPVERCLADSLHIIGINPKKRAAGIVGIPRDSYVEIPGQGTSKINDALFLGGPELVVQTLEQLAGVEIDHWFLTSFEGFRHMIEEVGGLEVEVPYAVSDSASGASLEAGLQRLDGRTALAFARNRKSTPNGDFSRTENQGLMILAALAQLRQEVRRDPTRLFTWLIAGAKYTQTQLTLADLFELALGTLAIDPKNVVNVALPGSIGFAGEASVVNLGGEADAVFADLADDGILESAESESTETEEPVPGPTTGTDEDG
jgi:polyisoprenyl-teichoic acid--peptidoglycan teichoic acid transferase